LVLLEKRRKEELVVTVLVFPRYKTHPPKIRGWGALRLH
jgi:hypothetical protein